MRWNNLAALAVVFLFIASLPLPLFDANQHCPAISVYQSRQIAKIVFEDGPNCDFRILHTKKLFLCFPTMLLGAVLLNFRQVILAAIAWLLSLFAFLSWSYVWAHSLWDEAPTYGVGFFLNLFGACILALAGFFLATVLIRTHFSCRLRA